VTYCVTQLNDESVENAGRAGSLPKSTALVCDSSREMLAASLQSIPTR